MSFSGLQGLPPLFTSDSHLEIHLKVDNSGNLIGGVPLAADFVITGTIDETVDGVDRNGDHVLGVVSGTLLTGEVVGPFQATDATGAGVDSFDLNFQVSGGAFAQLFGSAFNVQLFGDELPPALPDPLPSILQGISDPQHLFAGSFAEDFAAHAEGFVAPTPPTNQPPDLRIMKQASTAFALGGQLVTYTYNVTNPGSEPIILTGITDDNGTPGFAGDNFSPAPVLMTFAGQSYNVGDSNHDTRLDPGEVWQYTATVLPTQSMCVTINGQMIDAGTLSGQVLPSGDVKIIYRQSRGVVDNTYGTNASAGWTNGHKFSDLTGSDKAEFRLTDGSGATVLDFYIDYLSATTNKTLFPSGYGTLGLSGGDGSLVAGNGAYVTNIHTTISDDLNQSSAFYGFIVNSPGPEASFPTWDYVDGYSFVVSKAAFGTKGFGSVQVPLVHNSPSKLSTNAISPTPCNGTVTNTVVVTGVGAFDNVPVSDSDSATVTILTSIQPSSLSGYVYLDSNDDGIKQSGESGIGGATVTLDGTDYLGATVSKTLLTQGTGLYTFSNLLPGTYTITETQPLGYLDGKDTQGTPGTGTPGNDVFSNIVLGSGVAGVNNNFGELLSSRMSMTKTADKGVVAPNGSVTYTYRVTNTGSDPLSNVHVTDDNGTPGDTSDDFTPVYVSGDDGNGVLDVGETWTYTATIFEPESMCTTINGQKVFVGTLQVVDLGSAYKVIYRQNTNVVDNTYGTNASGWPAGHKFSDLTGSDKAEFRLTNGSGATVLDFYVDYLSATTNKTLFPSGYGTLGFSGGDGSVVAGAANTYVSNIHTTISDNLNQSPAFYTYTTNSPGASDPNLANWNVVDGYSFVVDKAAFGVSGLGAVTIPLVHNSPSKTGVNAISPMPCDSIVTNTAKVTATFGTIPITASASASVQVTTQTTSAGQVTASALTIKDKNVTVKLTNNGSTAVTLSELLASWPTTNGKLMQVRIGAAVIYDVDTSGGFVDVTTFKGTVPQRTINPGATVTVTFVFEKNANVTPANYDFEFDFTDGEQVFV